VRGFVVYLLGTDGQWHAVNDEGTFNFMPKDINNPSTPMRRVTLVNHNGQYQAWGNTFSTAQALDPIDPGCYDGVSGDRSSIVMASISENTTTLGTPSYITSSLDANANRTLNWPLATQNAFGREYPWRFDDKWGKYIIYSASTDRYCWANHSNNGFRAMEILLTVVDQ